MNVEKKEAVIFDFDGVILDSANIKTEAFLDLFKEYPQHQEAIKDYHIKYQGITRYKKFEWIYKKLLNKPYNETIRNKLGEDFSELVFEKILEADSIPGSIDFLKFLKRNKIPAFVASGTPDEELQKIVRSRNLNNFFESLYGSNISKEEAIDRISDLKGVPYSKLLFVGDAITDYEAALSREVPFIAVHSEEMQEFWKEKDVNVVYDLMEIPKELEFVEFE